MIVSFALTLIACGRMGDLVPVTDTQADSETRDLKYKLMFEFIEYIFL